MKKGIVLNTVVRIKSGYQAKTRIEEDPEGPYRLIQSRDFDPHRHLLVDSLVAFFPKRRPELYLIQKGDVLFQARGMTHFAVCMEEEIENTLAGGAFYILRAKTGEVLPAYLAWWLNQTKAQSFFKMQSRGAWMSFIAKNTLSRLPVQIPSLPIQEKVIKVEALQKREQLLINKLVSTRARLARVICMKAIENG